MTATRAYEDRDLAVGRSPEVDPAEPYSSRFDSRASEPALSDRIRPTPEAEEAPSQPQRSLRVLLTNHRLCNRGGSELYLRDVALALARRGHQPIAYAPTLGDVSQELRSSAIPVISHLEQLGEAPDLIHGQHNLPTMAALAHFSNTPAVFFCHGWLPWEERPPKFPRILRYVAVDRLRRERLVSEEGIDPNRVRVVPNFVDLRRFAERAKPLPSRPQKALLLSNQATRGSGFGSVIEAACAAESIELEINGVASGRPMPRPEARIAEFDLVFGRGRAAMEAMAVGAAVILCDLEGLGPLVTPENVERLAALNFGIAALQERPEIDLVRAQIDLYSPPQSRVVKEWIRSRAGLDGAMTSILSVYSEVLDEWHGRESRDRTSESSDPVEDRAIATYLEQLAAIYDRQAEELDTISLELDRLRIERGLAQLRTRNLEREAEILHATRALRLRQWLIERKALARFYRFLRPT